MEQGLLFGLMYFFLVIPLFIRVIMRKMEISTTYTWLLLLVFVPIGGAILYILIGELHLGSKKLKIASKIEPEQLDYAHRISDQYPFDLEDRSIDVQQIYKLSCGLTDYKATNSNKLEVLKDAKTLL